MGRTRKGFTVIELLMVFAIMGIMLAFGLPKLGVVRERSSLRSAKEQLAGALSSTRAAAIQKGRQAQLHVSGNSISVTVDTNATGARITVIRPVDLYATFQIQMTVRTTPDTVLTFDGRGFANTASGATARYVLTKGTMRDSVCVSRFGVVMKQGCAL